MINITTEMVYEDIKDLDYRYNKLRLVSIYNQLKERDKVTQGKIYDPVYNSDIKLYRSRLFLQCWSLYFCTLNPLLKRIPRAERFFLINLILANDLKVLKHFWFDWPNVCFLGKELLLEKLKNHRSYFISKYGR